MNLSVLQNFKPENLYLDPFPYLHIQDALPEDLYNQLANEYPESILQGATFNFKDFRYCQHEFDNTHITPLWENFVNFHSSKEYKNQVMSALEPGMRKYYPDILDKYLEVDTSLRRHGKPKNTASLEVQFVMNSSDIQKIRTPHLDQSRELFACLFYMKKPQDKSQGGDLIVYKKKLRENFKFIKGRLAPVDQIQEVNRVPYKANSLIIFLNTFDSIHGVSPRINAEILRRYVNIDCHIAEKLFSLDYL